MPLPGVSIPIKNGAIGGVVQSNDALTGLLLQGPAASGLGLLAPRLCTSLADAEAIGLDAAYDADNSVAVYKHVKEFYSEAEPGAKLWIMLVSQAVSMTDMVNTSNPQYAEALLTAADGKIRLLGVSRSPADGYVPTLSGEVDVDVINAIPFAHALAEEYAANYKPFRVVVEGREYSGTAGTLVDLKTQGKNRVAALLGDTISGSGAAIGLLLGRLSAIPVQRNPGRVKNGAVLATNIYLGTDALKDVEGTIESIHDKGWITFRRHIEKAGCYFTDDPTATAATDDYDTISNGRVVDKAQVIAYSIFVDEILDEILIDKDGKIETVKAKYYKSIIENGVDTAMTANSEISSFSAQIDVEQNVLATNQLCLSGEIITVGYSKDIKFQLGFNNPANT